jgi:hypothetical protein
VLAGIVGSRVSSSAFGRALFGAGLKSRISPLLGFNSG